MKALLRSMMGHKNPLRLAWHWGKSILAALRYGFPARKLKVIGVTGTDGKTSTVGMIAHILSANGYKVAAASTAFMQIGEVITENTTHLTSLSPFALQKLLSQAVKAGCTHAIIESSSHGLVQGRTNWTFPSIAAITNISLEHLDYHGSMSNYIRDKSLLFKMLRKNGTKVLNLSDDTYETYSSIPAAKAITYSNDDTTADLYASNIAATSSGSTATLSSGDTLNLSIPGLYFIDNALCAISCTTACGVEVSAAAQALQSFKGMPGRMERIDVGQDFAVYVDFAVSPQAYKKTLETLQKISGGSGRAMVLCSSCGDRMKEKRPEIGRICGIGADVVVACEDETYGEDPHAVLEEVWQGIDQNQCEAHKIFDRRTAIAWLFANAKPGDAIALCGMGPFSTMNKLSGPIEWDERVVAREELERLIA